MDGIGSMEGIDGMEWLRKRRHARPSRRESRVEAPESWGLLAQLLEEPIDRHPPLGVGLVGSFGDLRPDLHDLLQPDIRHLAELLEPLLRFRRLGLHEENATLVELVPSAIHGWSPAVRPLRQC